MSLNCSELTTSLQTLKSLHQQLNQQIGEFDSVKNKEESDRADKITMLKEIWQTRKGIKQKIKEIERGFYLSMKEVKEYIGAENFFGPTEVFRAFNAKVDISLKEVPPITFTKEELERARELGQFLILRCDKTSDGELLTMQKIMEIKDNLLADGGKLLYNIDWYRDKSFFTNDPLKLSWALVTKEIIPDTNGIDYLKQTEKLAEYIKSEVFKNQQIPKKYQEALDELERKGAAIKSLITSDLQSAAAKLEQLKITQLFRRTPAEIIYDLVVVSDGQMNGQKLLVSVYDWSKTRDSGGGFVGAGDLVADGADICRSGSAYSSIGVCLSRRSTDLK